MICIFIEIDKININAEKLEDMAVISIWEKPITPKITNTEYSELNKQINTNFICLKI